MRLTYFGKIADSNTNLLRNAGLAGVLSRSTSQKANLVNAMQIADQRGWNVAEGHEAASGHTDSIRLELRDRQRRHRRGRRGVPGQAAPDAGGRHLLRSAADAAF